MAAAAFDVFPTVHSTEFNFEIASSSSDDFERFAKEGQIHAFVVYQEVKDYKRIFHRPAFSNWYKKKQLLDNFKRCLHNSKTCQPFYPEHITWGRVSKKLVRNPEHEGRNTDPRLGFKLLEHNVFLVKSYFTFGYRRVGSHEQHLYQTTHVPLLCYVLPSSSVDSKAQPCTIRRNFSVYDEHLYKRYVFLPHSFYLIPPGIHYIVLCLQKTLFKVDIVSTDIKIDGAFDCRMHTKYIQTAYRLPPPTPVHEVQYDEPKKDQTIPCKKGTALLSLENSHVDSSASIIEPTFKSPFLPPPTKKRHVSQANSTLLSMPRVPMEETNPIIYDAPMPSHTILPTLPSVVEPLPVSPTTLPSSEDTRYSSSDSTPSDETVSDIILRSEYETITPAVSPPEEEASVLPGMTEPDKAWEELEQYLCAFESDLSKQSNPWKSSQDTSMVVSELTLPEQEDMTEPLDLRVFQKYVRVGPHYGFQPINALNLIYKPSNMLL